MVKNLLVVECQTNLDWSSYFEGCTLFGEEIKVIQAEFPDIRVTSDHDCGALIDIRNKGAVQVDFVFLRSVTRCKKGQDSRNQLFGLIHADIPSVNSLISAYMCLERPVIFAELKKIQQRLGTEAFPLIQQTYFPDFQAICVTPEFPNVAKVGYANSGYGKMKINDATQQSDFRSLCALSGHYITFEPFIKWDYDCRIQKIGNHYRAFKRVSMNWKGNVGNMSQVEEMEMTEQFRMWIDECSKACGGLDICGLDFLHCAKTGKYWILELNDTAIGLVHAHAKEDMGYMKDLVLARMAQHFEKKRKEEGRKSQEKKEKEGKSGGGGGGEEQKEEESEGEEQKEEIKKEENGTEEEKEEKKEDQKDEEGEKDEDEKEKKQEKKEQGNQDLLVDQLQLEVVDLKRQLHDANQKLEELQKPQKKKGFFESLLADD